jgi:hypothetical protein
MILGHIEGMTQILIITKNRTIIFMTTMTACGMLVSIILSLPTLRSTKTCQPEIAGVVESNLTYRYLLNTSTINKDIIVV